MVATKHLASIFRSIGLLACNQIYLSHSGCHSYIIKESKDIKVKRVEKRSSYPSDIHMSCRQGAGSVEKQQNRKLIKRTDVYFVTPKIPPIHQSTHPSKSPQCHGDPAPGPKGVHTQPWFTAGFAAMWLRSNSEKQLELLI